MATPNRGSIRSRIPAGTTLAAAGSLTGAGVTLDVSGTERVLIVQVNNGAAGTAGRDAIEISKDNGSAWIADDTLVALADDDTSGTVIVNGLLNAAGTAPAGAAVWKSGPHSGSTFMRCARLTGTGGGTSWVTGAPQVLAIRVGA